MKRVPVDMKTKFKAMLADLLRYRQKYEEGAPVVSDATYDALVIKAQSMLEKYPELGPCVEKLRTKILQTVGTTPRRDRSSRHWWPVTSLKTVFSADDASSFLPRIGKHSLWLLQPKLDGVCLNLQYEEDPKTKTFVLVNALTRGDGEIGENAFHVVPFIWGIPRSFPSQLFGGMNRIEIRGEVIYSDRSWERLKDKKPELKSPRNAVAGFLKRGNPGTFFDELGDTHPDLKPEFLVWGFESDREHPEAPRLSAMYDLLFRWCGFQDVQKFWGRTLTSDIVKDPVRLKNLIEDYEKRRKIGYAIDGWVIKASSLKDQRQCGLSTGNQHPNWAVAYKPSSPAALSKLKAVSWSVGRSGRLTPMAHIDPVVIAGATIQNITLHNMRHIQELGLHINDEVVVERRGGVIPKITKVLPGQPKLVVIKPPKVCSSCGSKSIVKEGEDYVCRSVSCSDSIVTAIAHAADVLNIEGISEGLISDLYNAGMVTGLPDLFHLRHHRDQMEELPRWGRKRAQDVSVRVDKARKMSMTQFLRILNVPHLGNRLSADVARVCPTLNKLLERDSKRIIAAVGDSVNLRKALDGLWHPRTSTLINGLVAAGVIIKKQEVVKTKTSVAGKTFMITGTLWENRDLVKSFIEAAGGVMKSSVSKNLDYLIAGKGATEHKVKKAQDLGVKVIDSTALSKLLEA